MGLKRGIALLVGEKGLKDLYLMIDVFLVGIYCLKGLPKKALWLVVYERLNDTLLNVMKHPSTNS